MKKRIVLFLTIALSAAPWAVASAQTQNLTCEEVSGKFNEFILPRDAAPNDPFGRVLGSVDGTLEGATTAFLTSFVPASNGGVRVTTFNAFSTQAGNQLFTIGAADWTLIKTGFFKVDLTLSVVGGTGKYAGSVGTINVIGVGNNVGPGSGQFVQEYRGRVCTPVR